MPTDALQRKVREAAARAKAPADFSKEHIVVTYTFNGRQGQRVLRCEGEDAFGAKLYYDYRTGETKTLEAHGKYWGAKGVKETHKVDLENLRATRTDGGGAPPPAGQQQGTGQPGGTQQRPPDTSHRQLPQPGQAGTPPRQQQPAPGSAPHRNTVPRPRPPRHAPQQPPLQKSTDGKLNPRTSEPKSPFEPPQGRPAGTSRTSAILELSKPSPIFEYYQRYYGESVHCASVAWGITIPYLCAEQGRSAVIFPVSSWKLRDYVTNKKNKEISALVRPLGISVRTNKDYYDIIANTSGALKPGAVMTLDSGHTYEGKLKGQPTHTMVYVGYGCWADNRNDREVIMGVYNDVVARSKDARDFLAQVAKETKNAVVAAPADLAAISNNGAWLRKGKYVFARENGEYFLYECEADGMTGFSRLASVPVSGGAAAVAGAIKNPWVEMAAADVSRIGSLKDGECAFLSPQINNRCLFSSLDGGTAKSIQVFGKDVFTGFTSEAPAPMRGRDGKEYVLRREYTAAGLPEITVYSAPSDVVYYIVQKNGNSLGISAKTHWLISRFMWCGESGVYQVEIEKMPPAKKRAISSSDFGLESTSAEGFASLLSKTYGIQFEYALNEIMRQNRAIPYPRARMKSISVVLAVILPDAKIGRISGPIELVETPAEREVVRSIREQKPQYTPTDKEYVNIRSAVIFRRDAYLQRCGDIDAEYYRLGIRTSNVDALKVILYNELFSSAQSLDEKYREKGFFSDREANKFRARERFGIDGTPFGDWLARRYGKENSRMDSWGPFQTNIDYVRQYLEGYHMAKLAPGAEKYVPDAALGAQRREELGRMLAGAGASKATLSALKGYAVLPRNRREAVADMLYDFPFALYFANMLLSENKGVIEDQAKKIAGRNYTHTDLEMTGVLAYNRGILRANVAIFQQNLLLAGQAAASKAMLSKDPSQRRLAANLSSTLKGMQVDGVLSDDGVSNAREFYSAVRKGQFKKITQGVESRTFEAFKQICLIKGIGLFRLGTRTYDPQKMPLEEFMRLFGTSGNYKRAYEFFSLPQFTGADFSSKADPGNIHPYPTLSYKFLKSLSEGNKKAMTGYLSAYMFYIKPVEEEPRGPTYSNATLKLDRYDWATGKESNLINITYTVPYSPGLGTMRIYDQKGAVVATLFEKARQPEGRYLRVSSRLPPGIYAVKYTVGDMSVGATIAIPPSPPAAK